MLFPQSQFESFIKSPAGQQPELLDIRRKSFARFKELGFPKYSWEDWRFINFSALEKQEFQLSTEILNSSAQKIKIPFQEKVYNLVFINSVFNKEHSQLPDSVHLQIFGREFPKLNILGDTASELNPFHSLNSAFCNSGFSLEIPANTKLDKPLHIFFLSTEMPLTAMSHPRFQIILGQNSEAEIIEHYSGQTDQTYWNNISGKIIIAEDASLQHIRLQEEGMGAFHIADTSYELSRSSRLTSRQIAFGAKLFRHNLKISFKGRHGEAIIKGLSLSSRSQQSDTNIMLHHNQAECTSIQLFKNVLAHKSRGVFSGRVLVHKGSHNSNASQSNKNLILSEQALMHSNPQLEIYNDDVKCNHGSTTGQLEEDAMFYFRSRGIDKQSAKRILVAGFAGEIFKEYKNIWLHTYLEQMLDSWLNEIMQKN